ncbi:MAG TPA: hypothetical protein GXX26_03960 [Clostridiaceae bacterium]|nr:hypothetical protein [Clostridiaceae bacterium]
MLPYFYVGSYSFTDEVLFEGNVTDILGDDIEAVKIRNCCLYDISCQTVENPDDMEQTMFFTLEVFCDVRYKQQDMRVVGKRINGEKKFRIPKKNIREQSLAETGKYYVIQHLNNLSYSVQTSKSRDIILSVTADIEGAILDEPHEDFLICSRINLDPPAEDKVQDWNQLFDSINIKDTVSLFESLLRLVKGVCSENANDKNKEEKDKLEKENMKLTSEIYELQKRVNDMKKEINDRGYIINGLLKIIKPL